MSLPAILAEQDAIKEDMSRLMRRMEENERRIQDLMNSGHMDTMAAPQQGSLGNGMASSGRGRGRSSMGTGGGSDPFASRSRIGRNPPEMGKGGYPSRGAPMRSPPAAKPAAGGYDTYSPQPMQRSMQLGDTVGARSDMTSLDKSASLAKAMDVTPDMDAVSEPKDPKKSTSAVDRCEGLLRSAFQRYMELQPSRNSNPISALQSLLRQLDSNQSGQIGKSEFKQLCKLLNFSSTEPTLDALFKRYDLDSSGYINADEFGRLLLKPEGDTTAKAKSAIARLREVLAYRAGGFPHLQAMYRQFRIADRDHSGELTKEEFSVAMDIFVNYFKVPFTAAEKNALFTFFDRDNAGVINYDEYIRAVRGDMNENRLALVQQAFGILDANNNGIISLDEIQKHYDVSQVPGVKTGKVSPEDAFKTFMGHYDSNHDGSIAFDEFVEQYNWVSASIDDDNYFELMIRNAWHISGGEGVCENTSDRRVLVTYTDGNCEVVEIKNDLGLDAYDQRAVLKRLSEQGVRNIKKVELFGGM